MSVLKQRTARARGDKKIIKRVILLNSFATTGKCDDSRKFYVKIVMITM